MLNFKILIYNFREIDDMIKTVDKNEDRKISYSEFRVRYYTYTRLGNCASDTLQDQLYV